jgi:hypothetical protein
MKPIDEEMRLTLEMVRAERDKKRPSMEDVVRTYDRIFDTFSHDGEQPYQRKLRGPDTWSWVDLSQAHMGFEKWFVLSRSAMEGTEGYPLLTVRLSVAPRLDSFLTFSQLVVGPSDTEIEYNLSMAISNHMGAFEGLRQSVSDMVAAFTAMTDELPLDKREIN